MKILFDTSVLVELDRKNKSVADFLSRVASQNHEMGISIVTVSELMTGAFLNPSSHAIITAKGILGQFRWFEMDGKTAEQTAKLLAYLHLNKKSIEYQDTVIAASAIAHDFDYIITLNKKDFDAFPQLAGRVFTPDEFRKELLKK